MVRRVFNFVYKEVRGLHQAAYVLALFALASQVLAVVRDRLLAHTFGAGGELDLYYAAFRVPDMLFVLFASALSVFVLLPFVVKRTTEHGAQAGAGVLSQIFTLFLVAYTVLAGVLAYFAPVYLPHLFPGLSGNLETLTTLIRILLLQPILLGISSLCGVITQMNHRFVLYAISPLLYNLGIIAGVLFLYPYFGLSGLAYGVVLGAFGHVAIQLPYVLTSKFKFSIVKKIDWMLLAQILRVSVPRALTLSVGQLVMLVLISFATLMTVGSVSVFQFASNLQSVPLAIIGVSYSVAAFPTLSALFSKQDTRGFNQQLLTAFRHIIFWSIPTIVLIVVLRAQIVRVLLGSGEFDWGDTRLTAAVLAIFVISLVAQAILLLLIRAFYACGRTFLPLWVAVGSGAVSIGLAVWLQRLYNSSSNLQQFLNDSLRLSEVVGSEIIVLVIAFVCGQFLQLFAMMALARKVFSIDYRPLRALLLQSTCAGLVGGAATYGALNFVVDGVNQDVFIGILLQGVIAGIIGVACVVAIYYVFRSQELYEIFRSLKVKFTRVPRSENSAN